MEQKHYETTFLFTAKTDEETKKIVKEYVSLLKEKGAKIVHQYPPIQKKLCYTIQKQTSGTYQVIEFTSPGTLIAILEKNYTHDERILRFLTVCLNKHAINFRQEQREAEKEKHNNQQ